MASITDSGKQIVRDVPDELKLLVQKVSRAFYQHKEDSIVLDYLLRNTIMNETQLHERLKLDRKMLRISLARLKAEHFLKDRLRIETTLDGKSVRQLYYYINYKAFVNVVKYKLHQIQKRIESQERDDSCKAVYKCSNDACSRTYTEFDIDKLADLSSIDFATGEARLVCTFCGRDVVEMEAKANDARQVLIKFNKQMEPIYAILRDVEQYTLSQEILEPKLEGEDSNDSLAPNGASASGAQGATEGGNRVITVDLGADVNFDPADKTPKEMPSWMSSTSIGSNSYIDRPPVKDTPANQNKPASSNELYIQRQPRASANSASNPQSSVFDEDHIKKTLMHHENKTMSHVNLSAVVTHKQKSNQALINNVDVNKGDSRSRDNSDSSDSESDSNQGNDGKSSSNVDTAGNNYDDDDEIMTSEDENDKADDDNDEEDEIDIVTVNGVDVAFNDVTEEQIAQMTAQEKEVFAKVGQKRFSAFADY